MVNSTKILLSRFRLAFLCLLSATAYATNLDVSVDATIISASGLFNYSYIVTNRLSSSRNLFSLALGETGSLTNIVSPAGWLPDFTSTSGFIVWTSQDPMTDLVPGAGYLFGFSSSAPPSAQPFLGFGTDPTTGIPTSDFSQGVTVGPSLIPEPATWMLVLTALGGLAITRSKLMPVKQRI